MSLSKITGVDTKDLREKFGLEPLYQYDRNKSENLVFMSPTVLLEDSELKHGGFLEMGAKKVLSLVTKDILVSKDFTLFQVPEITCLHMGYGKNSANKEGKMALSKKDAKTWLNILNLSALKLKDYDQAEDVDDPQEGESTEAMEVDPRSQLYNDIVLPSDSGLLIPQKGSRILCMSILVMNSENTSQKKKQKQSDATVCSESEEFPVESGDSKTAKHSTMAKEEADIESKGRIGANKISDFLSFWTLPYLLNYTQRKVDEIEKHHEARNEDPQSLVKTVKKSTIDIITEATQSMPQEVLFKLREKLEKYYSEEKLQEEYTLLKCDDGSPVVLVPLRYVFDTGKAHPLRIEDLGRNWESSDGNVLSKEEFLNAFVRKRAIQMDYFKCMKDAKLRQGVDYAIILPDEAAFKLLLAEVRNADANVLETLKDVNQQGRGMVSPRHSVVKCNERNLVVCFAYFQGTDSGSVAGLFRAIGAHYFNHFTIVFLHGSNFRKRDLDCKLGNLYPVREAVELSFEKGKLGKADKISFCEGIAKFVEMDFPIWHRWWIKKVGRDPDVKKAIGRFDIKPMFDPAKHLKAAFTQSSQQENLRKVCLESKKKVKGSKVMKVRRSNWRKLSKFEIQAANLNGHLLSRIQKYGRENNVGVTLAISNSLGPKNPPCILKTALDKIIFYFVFAVINAGLDLVFPSEPDEKNREFEWETSSSSSYSSTSEEEEEDESDEEMEDDEEEEEEEEVDYYEDPDWKADEEDVNSSNSMEDKEEEEEIDAGCGLKLDAKAAAEPSSRRTKHGASNMTPRVKVPVKRGGRSSRNSREESTGSESTVDYAEKKRPTAAKQKDSTQNPAAKGAKRKRVASRLKEKETGYSKMEDECSQQPATSEASSSNVPPTGVTVQVFPSAPDEKEPVSTARAGAPIKGDTAECIQKKSLKKDASSSRAQKRCRDAAEGTQDGSSSTAQKRCKVDSSTNEAGSDGVYDDNDDDYDVGNNEGSSDSNEEGEEEEQKPSSSQSSASVTCPPEEASQSGSFGSEAGSDSDDEEEQKPSSSRASASVTCLPKKASQIKAGRPEDEELERLANVVERWKPLGRRLKIEDAKLKALEKENAELSEQVYYMLLYWKQQNGNDATYQILFNALKNDLVSHRDLGEKFCCE